ncbi:hypothetical protein SAMN05192549_104504 [Duganella sacchari]|uniref:Uncharacterized protein n=1 Tax=Duganella sacchari TaxID=551987 RepID=A0A1M7P9P8_9BURK|nr:hypothetical protein [Duganella sacchari]SHN12963.1 hypothetical protein SAMN05192549_104504 [Duganella sacchari]
MKLKLRGTLDRFSAPTTLRGESPFLGATVQVWDRAIVGNMEQTLLGIKERAQRGPQRDISTATTSDVASYASRQLSRTK